MTAVSIDLKPCPFCRCLIADEQEHFEVCLPRPKRTAAERLLAYRQAGLITPVDKYLEGLGIYRSSPEARRDVAECSDASCWGGDEAKVEWVNARGYGLCTKHALDPANHDDLTDY